MPGLVLSARAEEMLGDLPPYLGDEPRTRRWVQAWANEWERLDAYLTHLQDKFLPHAADDEYRILSMWESLLGLTVAPAGVTLADRRTKALAFFRARRGSRGLDWVSLITTALGTGLWSHSEGPGSYQVVIRFPYGAGGYTVQTVERLARRITPAHLQVTATYSEGFIVGNSFVDPAASIVSQSLI